MDYIFKPMSYVLVISWAICSSARASLGRTTIE